MGYNTDFEGQFTITRVDRPADTVWSAFGRHHAITLGETTLVPGCLGVHAAYINAFAESRRMKRDAAKTEKLYDHIREKVGLPVGPEGGYYVGDMDSRVEHGGDVIDYNNPPAGQPGLWCKWEVSEDGTALRWNEVEKFYDYIEWLKYLIEHFFAPWGYRLDGEVTWSGEENDDVGKIIVEDNEVRVKRARFVFDDDDEDGGES